MIHSITSSSFFRNCAARHNATMPEDSQNGYAIRHLLILLGLMLVTPFVPLLSRWPWGLLFAVGGSFGIVGAVPLWRYKVEWSRFGEIRRVTASVSVLTALVSMAGLWVWYRVCSPNLAEIAKQLPTGNGVPLIVIGAMFACVNAFLEEIVCRGVLQDALDARFSVQHGWWLQGLVFGSLHGAGVPQGWIGVIMASLYGIALGWIRQHSKGIGLCCAVHLSTDAMIFALLTVLR